MAFDIAVVIDLDSFDAAIFDMDGVVTDSVGAHRESWKQTFDEFLLRWGDPDVAVFDATVEYLSDIDGKPRQEGVRSFLESRRIELPEGTSEDPPGAMTIGGLGNRKNEVFATLLATRGMEVYETTTILIKALATAGLGGPGARGGGERTGQLRGRRAGGAPERPAVHGSAAGWAGRCEETCRRPRHGRRLRVRAL